MYKILFLTDFSEYSARAMYFTKRLSKSSESEVVIFHTLLPVVGAITQMGNTVELTSVLYHTAEESLKEIEVDFQAESIQARTVLLSGYIQSEIEQVVLKYNINLIIMGTHGRNSLLDKIVGSTAAYVLTQLDTPTIVIPSKFHEREVSRVAFAHQLAAPKIEHLEEAFKFINCLQVKELEVVHIYSNEQDVYEPDQAVLKEIQSSFAQKNITFHFVQDDSVVNGLYGYMKENQTDFLITSSNKKTFWKRLLSGNISATLATEFDTPILVLKDIDL